jgi:8-oxo-dGTP pyrophosphatase MutT (NUDIX family)
MMSGTPDVILSAGVVVVSRRLGGLHYLLLRVHNYWDFPKGIVEPGEAPLAGAIREVREETTLDDLVLRWGQEYRETPVYRNNKIARYYVAESQRLDVDLPITEELGHPEHDEFRWLTYTAARQYLNDRVQPVLDWADALINGT